jgi:DNA-binding NarL/FixJ family response regulator
MSEIRTGGPGDPPGHAVLDKRPQPPEPVTIVVADGDPGRRATLVRWLNNDGRFDVVGQADDATSAVETIVTTAPDVAFVDIDLPSGADVTDGIAALAIAHRRRPAVRLVAVAVDDDDRAYAALAAGAMGLYIWNDPVATAVDVAAGVVRGESPLTVGWAGRIIDEVRWLAREPGLVPAPELTPTELEVLRRIAAGATSAAIAELHGVTVHLVGLHAGVAVTKVRRHHDDVLQLELVRPA